MGDGAVLEVEDRGPVRWIRLDRPAKHNPLGAEVRDGLDAQCAELEDRGDLRVVVLAGNGPSFSAGADLGAAGPNPQQSTTTGVRSESGWANRRRGSGAWQRLLDRI